MSSDSAYFDAGARKTPLEGAVLVTLPGLESLPSGCLVHRLVEKDIPTDVNNWIDCIEEKMVKSGSSHSRIYLQAPIHRVESALQSRGYRSKAEIAVIKAAIPRARTPIDITLEPVDSEKAWDAKAQLHQKMDICPDGHVYSSALWVEMEKQKCAAGYMKPYLIKVEDEIVGEVNSARWGSILRIKNLAVTPDKRLRNVARATVTQFSQLACKNGCLATGAFVLEDEPAMRVYERAGFDTAGRQTEWFKSLSD